MTQPQPLKKQDTEDNLKLLQRFQSEPDFASDYFESIRCCNTSEIRPTISKIIKDPEFKNAVAKLLMPRAPKWFRRKFVAPILGPILHFKSRNIRNSGGAQIPQFEYARKIFRTTTTELQVKFFKGFDSDKRYLFMSNHRDIIMDPITIIYTVKYWGGVQFTNLPFLATGENLFGPTFASDLMRLNRSFIVRRIFESKREGLAALKTLSLHIQYLLQSRGSVWIAQRQGRAKDGDDSTERGILTMLCASRPDLPFHEVINGLHLSPVSISYEYDPCDTSKAKELEHIHLYGAYEKEEGEDLSQINLGMLGYKGGVHIAYSKPLEVKEGVQKEEVLKMIDDNIHQNFKLFSTHLAAYQWLKKEEKSPLNPSFFITSKEYTSKEIELAESKLLERSKVLSPLGRVIFMRTYAAAVFNQLDEALPPIFNP